MKQLWRPPKLRSRRSSGHFSTSTRSLGRFPRSLQTGSVNFRLPLVARTSPTPPPPPSDIKEQIVGLLDPRLLKWIFSILPIGYQTEESFRPKLGNENNNIFRLQTWNFSSTFFFKSIRPIERGEENLDYLFYFAFYFISSSSFDVASAGR